MQGRLKHKLEMFNINEVETISENLEEDNKTEYYERIIKRIKNGI
jgi:hypothetical protein